MTPDQEADTLYIQLLERRRAGSCDDEIALDFAASEQLVGVEILGASRLFDEWAGT